MSQWCWAACVSMICRHHGYHISQANIVKNVYGGIVDMPGDDRILVKALNNTWTADNGQKFKISSNVFSPALGAANVDNNVVIDDLKNDRPLLNGSGTHATVTVRADYFRPPGAPPLVQRVHVIDPWPGAAPPPQMARFLTPSEMTPLHLGGSLRFLASVRISAA